MIESYEINSTFYAMRLLSHGLDISQIRAVEGDEYPATEFSREEQTRALEILHNIEASETVPFRELGPDKIRTFVVYLADRIEGLTTNPLAKADYKIRRTDVSTHIQAGGKGRRARIILVDDHTLILDALKNLLQPEFDVVGMFADGQAVVEAAPALNPDLIVLDIGMPIMNGLKAGELLKKALPAVKLIFLTMNQDPDLATEAFRLGASGYVLKHSAGSELVSVIRGALLGRSYVTPLRNEDMVKSLTERPYLTLRQKEVLQLLAEGRSMKEVALILKVRPRTVAFHKHSLMKLLRLETTADLIQFTIGNLLPISQIPFFQRRAIR